MVFDRKVWEKEYREKNREKYNAKRREWRQKNRDKINKRKKELRRRPEAKAKARAYQQKPEVKEQDRQRAAKWRKTGKGKKYRKQYYRRNRKRLVEKAHEYHARPEVKLRERRRVLLRKYGENGLKVFERDGFACQKCGAKEKLEVHHIDWDEANNSLENLAVLCDKCHGELHNFVPMRYRRSIFEEWIKNKGWRKKKND